MLHWLTERHNTCIWPLNTVSEACGFTFKKPKSRGLQGGT